MRDANRFMSPVFQYSAGPDKTVRPTGLPKRRAAGHAAKKRESPLAVSSHGLGVSRMDNSAESNNFSGTNTASDEEPVYISIGQFAKHFGLGESTVRHWCDRDVIPNIRIGRMIRIPIDVLEPQNWKDGKFDAQHNRT